MTLKGPLTSIISDPSATEFLHQAGPLLYAQEVENSVMLGSVEDFLKAKSQASALFLRVLQDGQTTSAAILIKPFYLILTRSTNVELESLVAYLKAAWASLPGVTGPVQETKHFADLWVQATGVSASLGMEQTVFKLEQVIAPKSMSGALRLASESDEPVIADWLIVFARQVLPKHEWPSPEQAQLDARKAIAQKVLYVWTLQGLPVSMVNISRSTHNGITIGRIFTPPHLRNHGYALALGAGICQTMLDSGKRFCVTYVAKENTITHHGCQELGFRAHGQALLMLFNSNYKA